MTAVGAVQYRFESEPFPADQVDVVVVRWHEALNAPYRAEIEIDLEGGDEDPLLLLGTDGVLTLSRTGLERRLTGVISEVQHLEPRNVGRTHVRVWMEPALALLELSQGSRIFQEKSAKDILDTVLGETLGEYGREAKLSLDATYPTREYCVQYRESNRAFLERLIEEEGISYAFEHDGDVERMVLADSNSFPVASTASSTVPFRPMLGADLGEDEVIYELRLVPSVTATKVTIRDHDFTAPSSPREATKGDDARESFEYGLGRSLTISDYSGTAYGAHDGDRQAGLRLEALQRDALVVEGSSRVIGLTPGTTITIGGHSADVDGDYLVTEVVHSNTGSHNERDPYANRFRCIPKATPYRPARLRAKPRVGSVQTAIVTGPSGEEIHTDDHGRVKVQFPWDLDEPGDDTSSCYLRVEQPWAGAQWGFQFIPRVGMEVVVHFLHGDPDRPVVTGCVYNSEHHPPYALPDEKTKSTIKSNSSPGGGGFNELRFEDKAGSEQVFLHAQKDFDEEVGWDHTSHVHNDESNKVGNNQLKHVLGHEDETVEGKHQTTVDGNRSVTATDKFTKTMLAHEKRNVGGDEDEQILSGGEKRIVIGGLEETFNTTETRTINGGQVELCIGGVTHKIKSSHADNISGMLNQVSLGGYHLESSATTKVEAASLNNVIAVGGMTVNAPTVNVKSSFHMQIDPMWFSMAGYSPATFSGLAVTVAGNTTATTGLAHSVVAGTLALTGQSFGVNGAKAGATGAAISFGTLKEGDLLKAKLAFWLML